MMELHRLFRTLLRPGLGAASGTAPVRHFHVDSPDLQEGGTVPTVHVYNGMGCTGGNVSPALNWHNPPPGTRGFAVTCYDPDAPTGSGWWHWQIVNLPGDSTRLARGAGGAGGNRPANALQTRNDYGESGYGGPCPPPGDRPHRYVFTVHALKVDHLDLTADASCALAGFMLNATKIETATLTALYGR